MTERKSRRTTTCNSKNIRFLASSWKWNGSSKPGFLWRVIFHFHNCIMWEVGRVLSYIVLYSFTMGRRWRKGMAEPGLQPTSLWNTWAYVERCGKWNSPKQEKAGFQPSKQLAEKAIDSIKVLRSQSIKQTTWQNINTASAKAVKSPCHKNIKISKWLKMINCDPRTRVFTRLLRNSGPRLCWFWVIYGDIIYLHILRNPSANLMAAFSKNLHSNQPGRLFQRSSACGQCQSRQKQSPWCGRTPSQIARFDSSKSGCPIVPTSEQILKIPQQQLWCLQRWYIAKFSALLGGFEVAMFSYLKC